MSDERLRYLASSICLAAFIAAQAYQELAYRFWIPASHGPKDDLLAYLLPSDQTRAILVGGTILCLIVPFVVIGWRYFRPAPVTSVIGVICASAFIGFETTHRSVDFFVVGMKWARAFAATASRAERDDILQRFALWNEILHGWFFPLMLSCMVASCAFAAVTWKDRNRGNWYYLAPLAFALNALRLLGRLLSNYAGQSWLDGLNDSLYFPAVFAINALLAFWFFRLAAEQSDSVSRKEMKQAVHAQAYRP